MITLNSTPASADVLGGCPSWTAAPFSGTGLPLATRERPAMTGTAVVEGTRVPAGVLAKRREQAIAERVLAPTYLLTNDSTTLGIHSPRRPQS